MGEAKRRKKLDSSYGQVPSLKTSASQEKHVGQIIDELHSQCSSELKTLVVAEQIPDNYKQIRAQLASWVENRFLQYRESDREVIASSLLLFFSEMSHKYDTTPIILICFMEILKPYLSLQLYEKIAEPMEDMLASFKAELELTSTT